MFVSLSAERRKTNSHNTETQCVVLRAHVTTKSATIPDITTYRNTTATQPRITMNNYMTEKIHNSKAYHLTDS